MKFRKTWLVGIVVAVVIGIAALVLGGGQPVQVVEAQQGTFSQVVEETGYVQVVEEQQIQATQAARVSQLLLEAGDQVHNGQLLMILTNPELEAEIASVQSQLAQVESQLEQAQLQLVSLQAQLNQARNDMDRKKALLDAGALSEAEYQAAQLVLTQTESQLAQQESGAAALAKQVKDYQVMLDTLFTKRAELEVKSSVDGILLDLLVKKGQVVTPGMLLAQVGAGEELEVKIDLLSDEIRQVQVGQKATISSPVLGEKSLRGQIRKIYPQAYERVSALGVIQRRVPVLVSLEETANLRPGYEVRVGIETVHKEDVTLLPREAIRLMSDGEYQVMAVVDNRIVSKPVKIGEKNQLSVEIIEGIQPGEMVVKDASLVLKEGSRVKPVW
ncbi:MAG: HlyD family efflux transporter periplasmic adaptor subunit [Syntrophomonadaceae bacterium]|jgi:HlyD family secretion protein|nr:efflux RND transporter periplasmic adaptor subunit [Bacillota bacterium]NLM87221.1 HlyD family efflux transporter periplasmic adaptor subunit [Syntrophomonadaceae bacterium]HQA49974.1 efflux RND transporter periplasmic adaptor subunit [Syntrophomonadaceae bacterium]HQD91121.1 efflux RND transporter periplasmic adaptor subunit [Syntrophomonadaceae bacterium]